MSIIAALALAATSQVAVVGPQGPELREVVAPVPETPQKVVPAEPEEPKCLKYARAFNYTAAALDVATTIAAIDRGAVEGNPVVTAILGKRPSPAELIAFKAVPLIGLRLLDKHFIRHGAGKYACRTNVGMGIPALIAAGFNLRFVF